MGLLSTGRLNLAKLLVAKHQRKCKFAKKLPVGMQPVIEVRGSMYLSLVLSPSRRRIGVRWSLSSGWDRVPLGLISAQNLTKSQTILKPQDTRETTFFILSLTISLLSLNLGQTKWPIISRTHCNFLLTGFCSPLLTWDAFPLYPTEPDSFLVIWWNVTSCVSQQIDASFAWTIALCSFYVKHCINSLRTGVAMWHCPCELVHVTLQ